MILRSISPPSLIAMSSDSVQYNAVPVEESGDEEESLVPSEDGDPSYRPPLKSDSSSDPLRRSVRFLWLVTAAVVLVVLGGAAAVLLLWEKSTVLASLEAQLTALQSLEAEMTELKAETVRELSTLRAKEEDTIRFAKRVHSTFSPPMASQDPPSPSNAREGATVLSVPEDASPPRFAVGTLISLSADYCRAALTNYHALRRVDAERRYDFLVLFEEDQDVAFIPTNPHCQRLFSYAEGEFTKEAWVSRAKPTGPGVLRVIVVPTGQSLLDRYPKARPAQMPGWGRALSKIFLFNATQYDGVFFMDADTLMVVSPSALFALAYDLAVPQDTGFCGTPAAMNTGIWAIHPSSHLFHVAMDFLRLDDEEQCISGHLLQTDQELMNCLCGYGGAIHSRRPAVHCGFLPWYMDVISNYVASHCADARVDKIQFLHFTGGGDDFKPWRTWPLQANCSVEAIAFQATREKPLEWFEAEERSKCFTGPAGLFTYWFCVALHADRAIERPEVIGEDDQCVLRQIA